MLDQMPMTLDNSYNNCVAYNYTRGLTGNNVTSIADQRPAGTRPPSLRAIPILRANVQSRWTSTTATTTERWLGLGMVPRALRSSLPKRSHFFKQHLVIIITTTDTDTSVKHPASNAFGFGNDALSVIRSSQAVLFGAI